MGLFDSIAGQVLGALTGQGSTAPQGGLMDVIGDLVNNPQAGGLAGLVKVFEQQGLGNVVASWVGTGPNQAISAEQIQSVLGNEQIQAMAQRLGFSPQDISGQLAQWLPMVVDKLTPDGQLPQGG